MDLRKVILGTEESYPAGTEEDSVELRRVSLILRRASWELRRVTLQELRRIIVELRN